MHEQKNTFEPYKLQRRYMYIVFADNTEITEAEFVFDWENKFILGNGEEARALFSKADIDDDGVIDSNDIPGIFTFFDTNGKPFTLIQ